MRPVRHTAAEPLCRTETVSPEEKVRPVPSENWSHVPMVSEPMASSGLSPDCRNTVTRSPALGFRPSAAWHSTMESPSSAANFFVCWRRRRGG